MRPFESSFKVTVGSNPVLDPWLGMKAWAGNEENIVKYFLTKAEYEERGGEYFKAHSASNVYYPSPHV
jgi:actin-related protein 5